MELVNTLFASLVGTDPFTGVDITIANCKSAYWDEGIVQQLINQALDEGEKFVGAGNDSNLLIVFYVQIMPDDFVMQLHRF
ncbi:hypothetical protein OC501_004083 [Escherichia coli]|nr:hypothetical protein [Escherichia coli]EJW9443879.1 hypothetical protein [Escherichia coli]